MKQTAETDLYLYFGDEVRDRIMYILSAARDGVRNCVEHRLGAVDRSAGQSASDYPCSLSP